MGGGGGSGVVVHQGGQKYIKVPLHRNISFASYKSIIPDISFFD